jgi:hypothetical protein
MKGFVEEFLPCSSNYRFLIGCAVSFELIEDFLALGVELTLKLCIATFALTVNILYAFIDELWI